MAKTSGPLLSLDAHGSLAKELTYSHKKTGQQVRRYNKPLVAPTAKQRGQRRITEFLIAQWQNMSAGTKATWEANAKASGLRLPGYHYFLREAQRDLYAHTGLCAYWHCNEIVGGDILDISGRGHDGALEPGYPANAPILIPSKINRFGNALHFDGSDDYINVGNPADLHFVVSGVFAIFFIIRITVGTEKIIFNKHSPTNSGWVLSHEGSGGIRFLDDKDEWDYAVTANTKLKTGQWAEVCVVYNNETVKIYINGIQSTTWAENPMVLRADAVSDFEFSNSQGWQEFLGDVDEVCYYNREPSAAEILTRYNIARLKV